MKNILILASLASSSFLLSSFTSPAPGSGAIKNRQCTATVMANEYEFVVEEGASDGPALSFDDLMGALRDSYDELTILFQACNETNADSQAAKIQQAAEDLTNFQSLIRALIEKSPECREEANEGKWRSCINDSHKRMVYAMGNAYAHNCYGSTALKEAIIYLTYQLKH